MNPPLNPQQREAVQTHDGPVLILAGAGTGKTRVITHRIANMIRKGIPPEQILAVTFTNKAAREMLERVNELVPRPEAIQYDSDGKRIRPPRPLVCTFHSLCVRILRQHIDVLGYKRNFVIYDESEQISAMKRVLSQISAKGENVDPKRVLSLLSRVKNGGSHKMDPGDVQLVEMLNRRYESALRACNAVDFDDLILLVLRLFREHAAALDECRERFRYVMVDEYQDTNSAQFEVVHALTHASRNLCVVGDDDQSIYGFRGAEIANLLDLEKHFPEVKVIKLEQNYRSTNMILNAANAVIGNNTRRRAKKLWSDNGEGTRIGLQSFVHDEEEARTVVQNIEYDRNVHNIPWGDQAVLFRTNMQARALELEFRKARVRYHLIGGQSFFDRREVRDFLAYLKLFLNPHDDISLLRVANVPSRGLSDVTMERLLAASHERRCSVFTAMRHTDVLESFQARTAEAIRKFTAFIEVERAALDAGTDGCLGYWAEGWLQEIGYAAELRRVEKNPEIAENRVRNLYEMLKDLDDPDGAPVERPADEEPLAEMEDKEGAGLFEDSTEDAAGEEEVPQIQRNAGVKPAELPSKYRRSARLTVRLDEYLADVTLDQERNDEKDEAGDAVTLITMHSCKGLEYPHVQIVGLEDGLLPHSRSKEEGTLDEERRLFYVAITRARKTLRISHCAGRKRYGQLLPCHPSPFLKELPAECIEDVDAMASVPVAADSGKSRFAALRAAAGLS